LAVEELIGLMTLYVRFRTFYAGLDVQQARKYSMEFFLLLEKKPL